VVRLGVRQDAGTIRLANGVIVTLDGATAGRELRGRRRRWREQKERRAALLCGADTGARERGILHRVAMPQVPEIDGKDVNKQRTVHLSPSPDAGHFSFRMPPLGYDNFNVKN